MNPQGHSTCQYKRPTQHNVQLVTLVPGVDTNKLGSLLAINDMSRGHVINQVRVCCCCRSSISILGYVIFGNDIITEEDGFLLDMIKQTIGSAGFSGDTYESDAKVDALNKESTRAMDLGGEVLIEKQSLKELNSGRFRDHDGKNCGKMALHGDARLHHGLIVKRSMVPSKAKDRPKGFLQQKSAHLPYFLPHHSSLPLPKSSATKSRSCRH